MGNDFRNIFDQLDSMSIGFGPTFRNFQVQTAHYPPHNIITISDTEFKLELAIAGFKKKEVRIEENQGLLTIKGDKESDTDHEFQYRGIAARSFSKSFRIAEFFEVSDAILEDGVLTVSFIKNVPEEAKPKVITIK